MGTQICISYHLHISLYSLTELLKATAHCVLSLDLFPFSGEIFMSLHLRVIFKIHTVSSVVSAFMLHVQVVFQINSDGNGPRGLSDGQVG
jgi:hypothetical protein